MQRSIDKYIVIQPEKAALGESVVFRVFIYAEHTPVSGSYEDKLFTGVGQCIEQGIARHPHAAFIIVVSALEKLLSFSLGSAQKEPCIILNSEGNALEINRANKTDLDIANDILKDVNGQTSQIQIRIYGSSKDDSKAIESAYNVLNTYKVS